MDARRMGHRNVLPVTLLEAAAPAYLTDTQWDQLGEDWLEQALAYTSRPCKGARGPVTRIRADRTRLRTADPSPVAQGEGGPVYRLVDFLEQHGPPPRRPDPPLGFWTAAAMRRGHVETVRRRVRRRVPSCSDSSATMS
jgi:hypothetical protein